MGIRAGSWFCGRAQFIDGIADAPFDQLCCQENLKEKLKKVFLLNAAPDSSDAEWFNSAFFKCALHFGYFYHTWTR